VIRNTSRTALFGPRVAIRAHSPARGAPRLANKAQYLPQNTSGMVTPSGQRLNTDSWVKISEPMTSEHILHDEHWNPDSVRAGFAKLFK